MRIARIAGGLLLLAGWAAGARAQDRPYYFRLDAGYSWAHPAEFQDTAPSAISFLVCGNVACSTQMQLKHVGASGVFGAGAGWRFSPQLRADLTYSLRSFKLDGQDRFPETIRADVNSSAVMLTGYWDIPLEYAAKPFVGLGIGLSRNSMGITSEQFLVFPGNFWVTEGVKNNVAFSIGAGASYKVSEGVTLEVGLRYVDLGKFQTGTIVSPGFGINLPYPRAAGQLRTNELTLGLRF